MPNTVPATLTLPSINDIAFGKFVKTDAMDQLAGVHNHNLSELRADPVVTELWDTGVMKFEDPLTTPVVASIWRYPIIGDSHDTLDIAVWASLTSGATIAAIRFSSAGSGANVVINVTSTSKTWYTATLSVAQIGATGHDDLTMELIAGPAQEVSVFSLTCEFVTLVAPGAALPAALVDGVEPMGRVSVKPDHPLTARIGRQLSEAYPAMKARPRVLYQWSKPEDVIATYTGEKTGADRAMGWYPHLSFARINAGDTTTLTAWVRAVMKAGSSDLAYVNEWAFSVPAGSGEVWVEPLASDADAVLVDSPSVAVGASSFAVLRSEQRLSLLAAIQETVSIAAVVSIVIWGE